LEAAASYLKLAFDLAPAELQATLAAYEDKHVEEMRVAIGPLGNEDAVIEGVVWPLLAMKKIAPGRDRSGAARARHQQDHQPRAPLSARVLR